MVVFVKWQIWHFVMWQMVGTKMAATDQLHNFCGRKNSKTLIQNYSNFAITYIPHDMEMCMWLQGFTEI